MNNVLLVSLLRASDGLSACISSTADDGALPLISIPLAQVPNGLYPQRDALLADWDSLRNARQLKSVWPAFWRVFWTTLPDLREQAPLAMPRLVSPQTPPQASAAHPRAFRGTKFQPPKSPSPVLDLCAWLSDDRLLDGFFARHDFARLPALQADGQPVAGSHSATTAAGFLARQTGVEPDQLPVMPEVFRRAFLWQLRLRPLRNKLAWLQLWRGLGSAQGGPELALPARLCALAPDAYEWALLALILPVARQSIFLHALIDHRTYLLPRAALSVGQLTSLDADTDDDQRFTLYVNAVLSNLNRQVSAAYSLCGCTLADRVRDSYGEERLDLSLRATKDCAQVPMSDIYRMSAALGVDGQSGELNAWDYCARLPGFDIFLRETSWESLSPEVAYEWRSLFVRMMWDEEDEEKRVKRWRAYLAIFPEWHRALLALPVAWHDKYVRMLRDYACGWDDVDSLRDSVGYLLPLQQAFCRPPFSASADGDCVLSSMAVHLRHAGWRQLAETDERTWLIIERECRRDNDAMLTMRGLYTMTQCWPSFTLRALAAAPRRLMRTSRLLGCLGYERRRQFLAEISHSAWYATNWAEVAPYEACQMIRRLCAETGTHSPVPRRLRDHFEGNVILSDMQIERHCRVSIAALPTVLLGALEQSIWNCIDTPFNLRARSTAAGHAVRLLAGLDGNRKGLRRFLLNFCQGRADSYIDHPLNRAWFALHPRIDAQIWGRDTLSRAMEGADEIVLALETDPLEILMLGTYVGSCLGIGGLCDYSAVACLLDANKQVVYARNAAGAVLARQLLAIDEQDRLICFAVYPVTASKTLVSAFHAFNHTLAKALDIAIYTQQGDEKYDIAAVVAQDWWDDGLAADEKSFDSIQGCEVGQQD